MPLKLAAAYIANIIFNFKGLQTVYDILYILYKSTRQKRYPHMEYSKSRYKFKRGEDSFMIHDSTDLRG